MALTDNLAAYWRLDEASGTRADSSGNGNTLSDNNTVLSAASDKAGSTLAADFEATQSESLSIATNASLELGSDTPWTISLWCKTESTVGSVRLLMMKRSGTAAQGTELTVACGVSGFFTRGANGTTNTSDSSLYNPGTAPSIGTWYHVVAWHDPVNDLIGISVNDNTPVTVAWSGGTVNAGAGSFFIGSTSSPSAYWDGLIAHLGYWKRVLTSEERTTLYNSGNGYDPTAAGGTTHQASAAIAALSAAGASAISRLAGGATVAGVSATGATARRITRGGASISGAGGTSAGARRTTRGIAAISGTSTTGAAGRRSLRVTAAPGGVLTVTADADLLSPTGQIEQASALISAVAQSTNQVRVRIEWEPNPPTEDVVRYRVFSGPTPTNLTAVLEVPTTNATVAVRAPSTNWFAVTAVNRSGLESDLSDRVPALIVRPSTVRSLKIVEYTIEQVVPAN